jgi:hypothetical protein
LSRVSLEYMIDIATYMHSKAKELGHCTNNELKSLYFSERPIMQSLPQGERDLACASSSSRDLPGGAILGVLEHDAHFGQLVADAVGFFKILGPAGSDSLSNPRVDFRRV